MKAPAVTFHWTHRSNLGSIRKSGLDPRYARGKMRVVWSCAMSRIGWALGHVARRHETDPDQMVLLQISTEGMTFRKTSWPNVWVTADPIPATNILGVKHSIVGDWTPLEETAMHRETKVRG